MNDMTPEKTKNLLESAINSNTAAWVAQSKYFEDLVKRNVASFAAMAGKRVESMKQINESKTFNEAFEANIAYEEAAPEELKSLYEQNTQAWDYLQSELKGIFMPATTDVAEKEESKAA